MIYIFTALYCEASAFIKYFSLRKDTEQNRFQVFFNEDAGIRLAVTGTGMIASAAAVSCICTEYRAGEGDFLLNVGICAGIEREYEKNTEDHIEQNMKNELFICNKIIEQTTGKTYYPDLLYRHKFREAQIVTGAKPFEKEERKEEKKVEKKERFFLYDMEASAIYQAGGFFFGPHQMSFLKIVSDCGNAGEVTAGQTEQLTAAHIGSIAEYIGRLRTAGLAERCTDAVWEPEPEMLIEQLSKDMYCSKTMSAVLLQYIRYCTLAEIDYAAVIRQMYQERKLPCQNKREGKRCFEELKQRLL